MLREKCRALSPHPTHSIDQRTKMIPSSLRAIHILSYQSTEAAHQCMCFM